MDKFWWTQEKNGESERNIKDSFESSGLYNWIDIDFYNN